MVAERHRVDSGAANADVLQLNQLTKIYQHLNKKVQAVKRLSVGIPAGEVCISSIIRIICFMDDLPMYKLMIIR